MDTAKLLGRISVNPAIQHGQPCIKGSRTPVYVVLEELSMGTGIEEIKREYPPLGNKDIQACLLFAALLAKEEEVLIPSK